MTGDPNVESDTDIDRLLGLLGNDVRMSIVRSLWERFDFDQYVAQEQDPTSFSTLFQGSPTDDSGNFNYHLNQLESVLVESVDDGYLLTPLGFNLMHTIDRNATFEYREIAPTEVDFRCPFCDGTLEGSYERELVGLRCRDCPGLGSGGNITYVRIPANGVHGLGLNELLDLAAMKLEQRVTTSYHTTCWECNAEMERSVDICEDHEESGPDGLCETCELRMGAMVDVRCSNCGIEGHGPLLEYALIDSELRSFFRDHDVHPGNVGHMRSRITGLSACTEEVLDADRPTVEYRFRIDDDEIRLRLKNEDPVTVSSRRQTE